MEIVVSQFPCMAVCQGLVANALGHGILLPLRQALVSFGLLCRVRERRANMLDELLGKETKGARDPFHARWGTHLARAKEEGRGVITDGLGRRWVDNCVDWFAKKVCIQSPRPRPLKCSWLTRVLLCDYRDESSMATVTASCAGFPPHFTPTSQRANEHVSLKLS